MVLDMIMDWLDNPAVDLVAALVLILAGLVHLFNPTVSTLAVVLDMIGFTVNSGSIAAFLVRFVGAGVVLKGLQMTNRIY